MSRIYPDTATKLHTKKEPSDCGSRLPSVTRIIDYAWISPPSSQLLSEVVSSTASIRDFCLQFGKAVFVVSSYPGEVPPPIEMGPPVSSQQSTKFRSSPSLMIQHLISGQLQAGQIASQRPRIGSYCVADVGYSVHSTVFSTEG